MNKLSFVVFVIMAAFAGSASAQSTADNYKSKCAMCHGADGAGATPAGKAMKTPPVSDPLIAKASDADLFAATKNGKGKMPAFAGKLTDPQIKDLVTYMRSLK
jgi:mono/diheme cytochrome c family protein